MTPTGLSEKSKSGEDRTCAMCGKVIARESKFCDRCFDIVVAYRPEKGGAR